MRLNSNLIKNLYYKKYRNIVLKKKDYKTRLNFQKNLSFLRDENQSFRKHSCRSCRYFKNKELWRNKNIKRLYKKFNVHLKLKYTYNRNLLSNTKKEACLQSYLIFLSKVFISDKFNDYQKLNTILKINDLILIKFFNDYKSLNLFNTNNFKIEHKLIKELL